MTMIPLSQAHLTLLDTCDRKYQYVFFDALSGPATYDQQLTAQWGTQFHRLMQQRSLGLPIESLTDASQEMVASMSALAAAAPDIFKHLPAAQSGNETASSFSQSEHRRTLAFDDYLLTVVYDLLVCVPEQGQIFDWKTHQKPPKQTWLQNDWQTRLYLYVLCETTDLKPAQISMTYWFVRLEDPEQQNRQKKPSFYQFTYSQQQHRQTQKDLHDLTARLTRMTGQLFFPKVLVGSELCESCVFNVRCDRASSFIPSLNAAHILREASQIALDNVEEIPL